jgi:site-specific recombinase XerD
LTFWFRAHISRRFENMGNGIYSINVDARIKSLEKSDASTVNKELIAFFADYCFTEGLGEHRVLKYVSTLKSIALSLDIDFDKADEKDIRKYISSLERSDKSEWTKHDYKVALKKFYRWMLEEDNPVQTKWISTTIKKKNQKLPEDILTESEILRLIDHATNKRDEALIALLWDIGARVGEVGNLLIKHLTFDELGAIIQLSGKTGFRRVRAVWSVEYLKEWLNIHPESQNPNAPLWFKFDKKNDSLEMLRYDAIRMRLKKIAKKAKINKKIHPHLFRHSRCTYMANYLTEAQMNLYFGWVQGSDMPSVYVHLSGRDVDDAILKANGVLIGKDTSMNQGQHESAMNNIDFSSIMESKLNKLIEQKMKQILES